MLPLIAATTASTVPCLTRFAHVSLLLAAALLLASCSNEAGPGRSITDVQAFLEASDDLHEYSGTDDAISDKHDQTAIWASVAGSMYVHYSAGGEVKEITVFTPVAYEGIPTGLVAIAAAALVGPDKSAAARSDPIIAELRAAASGEPTFFSGVHFDVRVDANRRDGILLHIRPPGLGEGAAPMWFPPAIRRPLPAVIGSATPTPATTPAPTDTPAAVAPTAVATTAPANGS